MPLLLLQILLTICLVVIGSVLAVFIVFEFYVLLLSARKGAPFYPSMRKRVDRMIALADLKPGDIAMDMGSGHGVIVAAVAKKGVRAIGIEMNPFLTLYSRWWIRRQNLHDRARIIKGDLRSYPFDGITVIFLYLTPATMELLRPRFEKELRRGTRIISNTFEMPGWTPDFTEDNVHVYVKK